jgi:predicted transposase/invertase (TIGR01784 family)
MTGPPINNPHHRFTRQSLMHLPTARCFLEHYLPADIVRILDVTTITLRDGSFIDGQLQENLSDLLFEVSLRDGGQVLVGVLFEHKSYSDRYVALQLTRYMVNIWEQQRRDNEDLLVVIPIVLYHGRVKWNAATSLRGLIAAPDELARFIPDSELCLVDLSTIPDAQLGDDLRLQIMLRVLKYVFDRDLADRLDELMPLVDAVLNEENSLQLLETVLRYIYSGAEHVTREQLAQIIRKNLTTETHVMPTIADELKAEGREQGREQGREEGREEGREGLRIGIQTIVEQRFPNVTVKVMKRVGGVTSIETLMEILQMADRCESASEFENHIDQL